MVQALANMLWIAKVATEEVAAAEIIKEQRFHQSEDKGIQYKLIFWVSLMPGCGSQYLVCLSCPRSWMKKNDRHLIFIDKLMSLS